MQSYSIYLPVESIRNTGTFFEGLGLNVRYQTAKQEVYVSFADGSTLVFVERETFTKMTGIQWQVPKDYAACIRIIMDDEDNLRNLIHIAMLSGGEIIKEPEWVDDQLIGQMQDYNGYAYLLVYDPSGQKGMATDQTRALFS